jgi:tetratricopeptide (TPR) repeat protein
MRICSVMFHPRTDDLAIAALKSVRPHVDACIVIDTHPEPYDFAHEWIVTSLLIVERHRELSWSDDACDMREHGLRVAEAHGFDWAITIDPDERLHVQPGFDLRAALELTPAALVTAAHVSGSYTKERCIRLPARGRWQGVTHETFAVAEGESIAHATEIAFGEVPKDPAEQQARNLAVEARLRRQVEEHPDDARAWLYLGHTLFDLARYRAAIDVYSRALSMLVEPEERGWCAYQAGICRHLQGQHAGALHLATSAIKSAPWMPEAYCLAARASLALDMKREATAHAITAITHGRFDGYGEAAPRLGFVDLPMHFEDPFYILAAAMGGDTRAARDFRSVGDTAKAARLELSRRW